MDDVKTTEDEEMVLDKNQLQAVTIFSKKLSSQLRDKTKRNKTRDLYYRGKILPNSLGQTPEELRTLPAGVGWARKAVDGVTERIELIRIGTAGTVLGDALNTQLREFSSEVNEAIGNACKFGVGFILSTYGNVERGERDIVSISLNPMLTTIKWDRRLNRVTSALLKDGSGYILLDDLYVYAMNANYAVTAYEEHGFSRCPISALGAPHGQAPFGESVLTREMMNLIDAAARTIQDMEVSRAAAAYAKRFLLNIDPLAMRDANTGEAIPIGELTAGSLSAIAAGQDGNASLAEFSGIDINPFIESYRLFGAEFSELSSIEFNHLQGSANPTSAEAMAQAQASLVMKVKAWIKSLHRGINDWAELSAEGLSDGVEITHDEIMSYITIAFRDPRYHLMSQNVDSVIKLISANVIRSDSRFALTTMLGLTEDEADTLAAEWQQNQAQSLVAEAMAQVTDEARAAVDTQTQQDV